VPFRHFLSESKLHRAIPVWRLFGQPPQSHRYRVLCLASWFITVGINSITVTGQFKMLGQIYFGRFEPSGMPATNSTPFIVPSTISNYNQLVIMNRVVSPHFLNARILDYQNQMTKFAVAFFPVFHP
jgi:hypothetical protein